MLAWLRVDAFKFHSAHSDGRASPTGPVGKPRLDETLEFPEKESIAELPKSRENGNTYDII
jgi:hypothetical protein